MQRKPVAAVLLGAVALLAPALASPANAKSRPAYKVSGSATLAVIHQVGANQTAAGTLNLRATSSAGSARFGPGAAVAKCQFASGGKLTCDVTLYQDGGTLSFHATGTSTTSGNRFQASATGPITKATGAYRGAVGKISFAGSNQVGNKPATYAIKGNLTLPH
jgi:hypothetical protein